MWIVSAWNFPYLQTLKWHDVTVWQLINDWLINTSDLRAWNGHKGMKSKGWFFLEEDTERISSLLWFCWHSRAIQHSVWEKVFYHWIFSTQFSSSCKLIFLSLRKKPSFEDVNRHITYVEVFEAITLWYFDVIRSEGNYFREQKIMLGILWATHQAGVECVHTHTKYPMFITFNDTKNPDFTAQSE